MRVVNKEGVPFNVVKQREFGVDVVVFYDERYTEGFTNLGQRIVAIPLVSLQGEKGFVKLQVDVSEWVVEEQHVQQILKKLG